MHKILIKSTKATFLLILGLIVSCTSATTREKAPVTHPQLLIEGANIISMEEGDSGFLANHSILIERGKIKKIFPTSEGKPANATIINGEGKYVLPALIDAHVHVWDTPELAAYPAHGIGTIRNASGMPYHLEFIKDIEAGRLVGPRLITTGPILNGQGPNTQINHQVVSTQQEAKEAVLEQFEAGYRNLKVYSNLSLPVYQTILAEAKRLEMTVMGHTPEGVRDDGVPFTKPFRIPFNSLLNDGFVSIEHMESIVWHGLADNLDESELRKLAKAIAQSRTPVTPTLIAHHNLVEVSQTSGEYLQRPGVNMLNPFIAETEQDSYDFWSNQPPDSRTKYDQFYGMATKVFQEEGVLLLAGTDSGIFTNIPGVSLIDELNLMVMGGLTAYEAIKTATTNPAEAFGLRATLGRVKVGYVADLILVDDDPLKDISNLKQLSGVLVQGRWFDKQDLAELKKQAENTSYENSKRRVVEGLAAQGVDLEM